MTKYHLIARAAVNIVGIWCIAKLLDLFCVIYRPSHSSISIYRFVVIALFFVPLLLIAFYVLFGAYKWIGRITGSVDELEPVISDVRAAAFLRVSFFLCGLLIVSRNIFFVTNAVSFLVYGPRMIFNMVLYGYVDEIFYQPMYQYIYIFTSLFETVFGVYLLFGAPALVRLQIRRFKTYRSFTHAQAQNGAIT